MANTAKAQAIFKGMTPEQQQTFLNKQKTASAGDQAKVTAALKPVKPVVSTPAATTPAAPEPTVQPSVTTPPNEPQENIPQDNTVGPAEPVTPQIDKAKVAWMKLNADQQKEFAQKHNFDPSKYGLEYAKGTQKPQQPQQPVGQQPTSTTPEATPAAADTVAVQPNYQDNSTARLQEIRNNLDQQLQQAPTLFNDRMAFDANFNYSLRSKEQKAVLDNFWYQKQQSDVFNATPTEVLANEISTGQTSIDAFSFMKDRDPVKYAALQGAVEEANKKEQLRASLDPATFMKDFTERHDAAIKRIDNQQDTIDTAELIPAITKGKEELAVMKSELDQLELDKAQIKKDVLSEYEGKGISKSLLNEIVADRQQTLTDQANSKILQYNSKLGMVNANLDQMKMFNDLETQRYELAQSEFENKATIYGLLLKSQETGSTKGADTVVNPITGEIKQWNPETNRYDIAVGSQGGYSSDTSSQDPSSSWNPGGDGTSRTDRHNNPTAFTTDIAKQAGLVEGVDYEVGDPFPNNPNLRTANLLGDPLEVTKRVIDKIGFKTQKGQSRWTYTDSLGLNNETWAKMSDAEKDQAIMKMYDMETKGGSLFKPSSSEQQDMFGNEKSWSEAQSKFFEDYDKSDKSAKSEYNYLGSKGLKLNDYIQWKNQEDLAASDYVSAYTKLSPDAQAVVSGRKSLSSIVGLQRNKIANEISQSGVDSFGMGDQDWYTLKPEDKRGIEQYATLTDKIRMIDELAKTVTTGRSTEISERAKGQLETFLPGLNIKQNTNFNTLKTITGKILVDFIKKMSGTAVSNQEREALIELLPSTSNSPTKFMDNLEEFKREYNTTLNSYLNTYGFMDIDSLRQIAGNSTPSTTTTKPNTSMPRDQFTDSFFNGTNQAFDMINAQ